MNNPNPFSAWLPLAAALALGPSLLAQYEGDPGQIGDPSSHGSGSYGGLSGSSGGSYGSSGSSVSARSTYGSSSTSYGRSNSSYGASSNSRSARSSYGNSRANSTSSRGSYRASRGRSRSSTSSSRRSYGASRDSYGDSRTTYGQSGGSYGGYANPGSGYGRRQSSTVDDSTRSRRARAQRDSGYGQDRQSGVRLTEPVFIQGRVLTSEGTAARDVPVQMSCGGATYSMGYTDRSGRFNFPVNRCYSLLTMADASTSFLARFRPVLSTDLSGCWLEAGTSGYRMGRLDLGRLMSEGRNYVGLIVLDRLAGRPVKTVSIDSLTAPPAAKKAFRKGLRALRRSKPNYPRAAKHLMAAVDTHPRYTAAWAALGEAFLGMNQVERAQRAFRRAIEVDPKFLAAHEALIQLALEHSDWESVGSLSKLYLDLAPASSRVRFYSLVAAFNQQRKEEAISIARKLKDYGEMDIWPVSYFILGSLHATRAEFEEAATQFRAFLGRAPSSELAVKAKRFLYEWSMLQVIESRGS